MEHGKQVLKIYRAPLALGSVSVLLVIASIAVLVRSAQPTEPIRFIDAPARPTLTSEEFRMAGQVNVSVNHASTEELEALRGIGPVTAQKIIDHRPYQTLEELVSKKAMGSTLFEKLKEQLAL